MPKSIAHRRCGAMTSHDRERRSTMLRDGEYAARQRAFLATRTTVSV
jgi:hypothetical protein